MAAQLDKLDESSHIKSGFNNGECKLCSSKVIKGIRCITCKWWFHEKCSKISLKYVNSDHKWSCDDCMVEACSTKLVKIIAEKDDIIKALQNDININMKYDDLLNRSSPLNKGLYERSHSQSETMKNGIITDTDVWLQPKNYVPLRAFGCKPNRSSILSTNKFNLLEEETLNFVEARVL